MLSELKKLNFFLEFLKELIYDRDEEKGFTNPSFNARKFMLLCALIFCMSGMSFFASRSFEMAGHIVTLTAEVSKCTAALPPQPAVKPK